MARILVIDDEKHIRDLYSLELSAEGYRVDSTGSCANLPETLKVFNPDLIILDIRLVDHDGLDILLGIRQRYPDLPLIICSAYDSYRSDLRTLAADAYVAKSFDLSQLKTSVQRVLETGMPTSLQFLPVVEIKEVKETGNSNEIGKRRWECIG
jgi:DNA-binding response OmpR family regulator